MRIRVMFGEPYPAQPWDKRPALIGNEVEPKVTIDLAAFTVSGFVGAFAQLPSDLTQRAKCYTSTPFTITLTEADRAALMTFLQAVLTRAGEQSVGGMAPTSTVRID